MRIADLIMISNNYFDIVVVFSVKINLDRAFECKTVCMMSAQIENCKKMLIEHAQI